MRKYCAAKITAMRLIALLFTLVPLVSCNHNGPKARKITIGFSQCTIQDEWRKTMVKEMRREIDFHLNYDIKLMITDARNDSRKQVQDVKQLISAGIDLLIISPNEGPPLTEIVEQVYDQGIPVIVIDRKINSGKFTSYIGGDNFVIGKEAALFARQLLNGKGRILEIMGLANSTPAKERSQGFSEGIKQFPQLKIVKTVMGDWLKERAQIITDTLLSGWKDFDLIYAHNDQMAYGAYLSAKKHNIKPFIIGVDGLYTPGNGIDMVLNGNIDGTFLYPTGGDKALDLALRILEGDNYSKFNYLQTIKIDNNNARAFKLQTAQLMDQSQRIDHQRKELGQMAFLLKKKETLFVLFIIISALLFLLVGIFGYFTYEKNRVNHTLDLKRKTLQDKNRQISEQRDKLIRTLRVAEEATESKVRFFTNVSHEIKTVLSLISVPNHNLPPHNGEENGKVELFEKSINRLLSLSNEIVNFRQSNYTLKVKFSNLAACLNEIVKVFEQNAIEKGITLISEFPPKMDATFDSSVIEKVMFNLISNAIKYTRKGGEIKISAAVTEDLIKISVQDTGVGIPEEELPFIFERFYRGRMFRQKNGELGSGVGLDFTKELIQLHGGDIKVNNNVNVGSTFTISLPQKDIPFPNDNHKNLPANGDAQKTLITPSKKMTVLLVEDLDELREYMTDILSKYFFVITAKNGVEAFEHTKLFQPDIVLSDILMPEKDGIELCHDLKNDPSTFLIPIILLTAMDSETSFIRSFEVGADGYLSKPCKEEVLISRINGLIESRRKLKEEYGKSIFQLTELKSREKHDEDFLKNCLDEIYKGISDPNFNLDTLARRIAMSRSSFYRKIKETTGLKATDFLRKAKLQFAAKLLLKSDMLVSEIAWESGFSDVKYFSRIFAKEFGKLPSKYHG